MVVFHNLGELGQFHMLCHFYLFARDGDGLCSLEWPRTQRHQFPIALQNFGIEPEEQSSVNNSKFQRNRLKKYEKQHQC
eukprot:6457691-Amphidinium_carterae.1